MRRRRLVGIAAWTVIALCGGVGLAQTSAPSYPQSPDGLAQYFKDMLALGEKKDAKALVEMCQSLVLPDSQKWFKTTFGDKLGARLAAAYDKDLKDANFAPALAILFLRFKDPSQLAVSATSADTPDDPTAKTYQIWAIQAMKKPVTLYSVSIRVASSDTQVVGMWSFVFVEGKFRFAGKMMSIRDDQKAIAEKQ